MFEKIKQLKQLRDLQGEVAKEKFESEKEGVKVVMNGAFMVEEIILNPEISQEQQQRILQECFNEVIKKAQLAMAQKFRGMM
ncbi:MAG: YbaB/EbfC family nucleoid-associated protein [Candidatus Wildermuthbacteria bacterium]|nr:YbaB/EbfC family nucleoid-associated protein [Candidatus Wildermuthbacteria bacterium]